MKISNRVQLFPIASLLLLTASSLQAGCGNNETIKEDPAVTKKRVENATTLRSYYEKSHGNYDALSPADKAAMDAQTGSEAHSRTAMGYMSGSGKPGR